MDGTFQLKRKEMGNSNIVKEQSYNSVQALKV